MNILGYASYALKLKVAAVNVAQSTQSALSGAVFGSRSATPSVDTLQRFTSTPKTLDVGDLVAWFGKGAIKPRFGSIVKIVTSFGENVRAHEIVVLCSDGTLQTALFWESERGKSWRKFEYA